MTVWKQRKRAAGRRFLAVDADFAAQHAPSDAPVFSSSTRTRLATESNSNDRTATSPLRSGSGCSMYTTCGSSMRTFRPDCVRTPVSVLLMRNPRWKLLRGCLVEDGVRLARRNPKAHRGDLDLHARGVERLLDEIAVWLDVKSSRLQHHGQWKEGLVHSSNLPALALNIQRPLGARFVRPAVERLQQRGGKQRILFGATDPSLLRDRAQVERAGVRAGGRGLAREVELQREIDRAVRLLVRARDRLAEQR